MRRVTGRNWKILALVSIKTLAKVLRALLYRMEQPEETVEQTVSKIKERKMGMLFEHLEINFAEEQRKTEEARKEPMPLKRPHKSKKKYMGISST